jgi:hypothetical protein
MSLGKQFTVDFWARIVKAIDQKLSQKIKYAML